MENCPTWLPFLLAIFGPLVPALITFKYYVDQPILTVSLVKSSWLLELPLILIPIHYVAVNYASKQNAWLLIGFVIGLVHAFLGRYRYNLPGRLWLLAEPDLIFLVATVLWVTWYGLVNQTIFRYFCPK